MIQLTERQRKFARHALGLPNRANTAYRNRFFIGPGCDGYEDWEDLVAKGLALNRPPGDWFVLTLDGALAVLFPTEHIDHEYWATMRTKASGRPTA